MKAHDLAQKLLDGPNDPVILCVTCPEDAVFSTDEEGKPIEDLEILEMDLSLEGRRRGALPGTTIIAHVPGANFAWVDD